MACAEYLAALQPDVVLLQDVNGSGAPILLDGIAATWHVLTEPPVIEGELSPASRRHLTMIAGTVGLVAAPATLPAVPMPERLAVAELLVTGWPTVTLLSYYAPPGVRWKIIKPRQAVATAQWLAQRVGPVVLGADANTPQLDPVDPVGYRTHWPTGAGARPRRRSAHSRPGRADG